MAATKKRTRFRSRKNPYLLHSTQIEAMQRDMEEIDLPSISKVPGHETRPTKYGKGVVYFIQAEVYYNYLVEQGLGERIARHGVINHEVLVGMYGNWGILLPS